MKINKIYTSYKDFEDLQPGDMFGFRNKAELFIKLEDECMAKNKNYVYNAVNVENGEFYWIDSQEQCVIVENVDVRLGV